MLRLSEEQRAILSCYSGAREDVVVELRKAILFIEDVELKEFSAELLVQIKNMTDGGFVEIREEGIMDAYNESEEDDIE